MDESTEELLAQADRRSDSLWNRFRRAAAKQIIAIVLVATGSFSASLFVVITNGIRLPARVAAVEVRQSQQRDTLSLISHQVSDTVIPLMVWQTMRLCGALTQERLRDNAEKCGMAAHRSGAIFPAPFGSKP